MTVSESPIRFATIPLVALSSWWTLRAAVKSNFWCFLDFVNLPFHEAGHIAFSLFGETLHILGGALAQLLIPGGLVAYFLLKERKPFAAAFCFWWFGENFVNIARYMADARELELPLAGGGDHDWNELFYRWNLLTEPRVHAVATAAHHFGVGLMLAGVAWLVVIAFRAPASSHR